MSIARQRLIAPSAPRRTAPSGTSPAGIAAARQLDDISSVGVMTMASTLTCSIAAGSSMTMNASVTASVNGSANARSLRGQQVDDRVHAQVLAAPDRERGAEHGEPQEKGRGQLVGPDQRPVNDVAGDDADEQDARLDHDQRRAQQFERAPMPRSTPSTSAAPPDARAAARYARCSPTCCAWIAVTNSSSSRLKRSACSKNGEWPQSSYQRNAWRP